MSGCSRASLPAPYVDPSGHPVAGMGGLSHPSFAQAPQRGQVHTAFCPVAGFVSRQADYLCRARRQRAGLDRACGLWRYVGTAATYLWVGGRPFGWRTSASAGIGLACATRRVYTLHVFFATALRAVGIAGPTSNAEADQMRFAQDQSAEDRAD